MLITMEHALKAKAALKEKLGRPEWLRGIGISYEIGVGHYIKVNVREEQPDMTVPCSIDGVTVRTEVVGEIVAQQPENSEARHVAKFIHEQWPYIPEDDAFEFYVSLGHIAISEGSVKVSLWCLKRVLEHEGSTHA